MVWLNQLFLFYKWESGVLGKLLVNYRFARTLSQVFLGLGFFQSKGLSENNERTGPGVCVCGAGWRWLGRREPGISPLTLVYLLLFPRLLLKEMSFLEFTALCIGEVRSL